MNEDTGIVMENNYEEISQEKQEEPVKEQSELINEKEELLENTVQSEEESSVDKLRNPLAKEPLELIKEYDTLHREQEELRKKKRAIKKLLRDSVDEIEDQYSEKIADLIKELNKLKLQNDTNQNDRDLLRKMYEQEKERYKRLTENLPIGDDGMPVADLGVWKKKYEEISAKAKWYEEKYQECLKDWWGPEKQSQYLALSTEIMNKNGLIAGKNSEIAKLEETISALQKSDYEFENQKKYSEALERLNSELQTELEKINSFYRKNKKGKFSSLFEYDKELETGEVNELAKGSQVNDLNLAKIAQHVRKFGITGGCGVKLRYDEDMICGFIASLGVSMKKSKLIILQGLSGTGKSSLPDLFAKALSFDSSPIPVQPSWRDRNDLLGFDNDFTGVFKETEFTKLLFRAQKQKFSSRVHFIVLDEFNLSRIEYYFADFLSTLEQPDSKRWKITLAQVDASDETAGFGQITIPENLWFIGTANIDESTQSITDKVYDRAQILNFVSVPPEDESQVDMTLPKELSVSFDELKKMFDSAWNNGSWQIDSEGREFLEEVNELLVKLKMGYGARVESQLKEYYPVFVASYSDKKNARIRALDMFISTKLLYKLEKRFSLGKMKESYKELRDLFEMHLGTDSKSFKKIDSFITAYE